MELGKKEEGIIRKGPWKAEEDEVLINHVNKYGPRDWSSIRSKGLLQRTGKSCRLRWVNKLRPNLKNGCKFSLEEERVVIELQAELGNKWARIATYLPGRTDNDVKNFWSSRQKRLARILHSSSSSSTPNSTINKSHSHNNNNNNNNKHKRPIPIAAHNEVPPLPMDQGRIFSASSAGELSSKVPSYTSSFNENSSEIKMVSLPDLVNPKLLNFEQDLGQPLFNCSTEKNPCIDTQPLNLNPFPPMSQSQLELAFPSEEHQDFLARFGEPYFDVFGSLEASKLGNGTEIPFCIPPFLEPVGKPDNLSPTPDSLFDDFPVDMFDQIESLPSPPPP
ncbi:Transcription factor GAMYB [Morus notabilis]|uniref:Transcription factor GAMYB n=1 Tax=Morus notabilis TaxID=981085 RepID=W9RVN7_9ROSA|nr:Transcription factor GAMYB [Morus notabilis]